MEVLVAAGIYPPDIGGPATYAKMLADELPRKDIGVRVVAFATIRALPQVIRHAAYAALLLVRSFGSDVIYAQDPASVGVPARIISILTRKPLVLRVGGDFAWEQGTQRYGVQEHLDDFAKGRHVGLVGRLQRIQSWVARGARAVIVPSEYLKQIVVAWGVPADNVRVVHSAFIPVAIGTEDRDILRERFGMTGSTIVSAGRLVPWKGMRALIEAIVLLPEARLVIAGDGPERTTLEEYARECGVANRVVFRGPLPREQLFALLRAADAFVLNTGYEGMSYQLLEVMSLGTPIVTTHAGGNPEIIENGKEGVLVPFNDVRALADAMRQVLGTDMSAMVAAAKRKSAMFSVERAVNEIIGVLTSVCAF